MPLIFIPILVLLLPVIEIAVFIYVGSHIGIWSTILLVILAAAAGALVLRFQGLGALRRINSDLRRGETPERGLVDTFFIVLAGILLIIPGFVTDIIAFLLMIPVVRMAIWGLFRRNIKVASFTMTGFGKDDGGYRRPDDGVVDLSPEDFERHQSERPSSRGRLENRD